MKKYNISEFMNLLDVQSDYVINTIEELLMLLDENELNFWSYAPEDVDEIKDFTIIAMVQDKFNDIRYFEIEETETY